MKEMAINYFKFMRKIVCEEPLEICPKDSIAYQATLKEKEFYDMAIQAFEQEPFDNIILSLTKRVETQVTEDMDNFIFTTINPWCEAKEQRKISKRDLEQALTQYFGKEPCKDAISRHSVLAQINRWIGSGEYKYTNATDYLCKRINSLTPVTPQPKTRWIPVSERLPKKFSYVNCTCRSLIDDREDWVIETCYVPQPSNSPYSDWGNIPMLNDGDCEVVAWMYREIPEPYKAEGSEKE